MNPMQQIMQIMRNGGNPQAMVQQIINTNPQAQAMFSQMKMSGMSNEQFVRQYAKQNNIDLNQILGMFGK